ncbi:MAG: hypothetical protein HYS23_14485 [Geobacter sp.]|nr:hypothetical protein [Geobacter sp.]
MKRLFFALLLTVVFTGITSAQGVRRKPQAYEYGQVIINNSSSSAGLAPVTFDHWIHRSKFTCRLCHVDIGFAMKAGVTGIRAADNMKGLYCGTCHNGKYEHQGKKVFEACSRDFSREDGKRCEKCHYKGRNPRKEQDFLKFAERMPKERFGNGINWEKAEDLGYIKPIDYLEGISVKRKPLPVQKDFAIGSAVEGLPDTIFSHKKHTVWNGCEVCHPDIFVGVKRGSNKYSMQDVFEGKYCGVCHVSVAFPLTDCQRCHIKPVQ